LAKGEGSSGCFTLLGRFATADVEGSFATTPTHLAAQHYMRAKEVGHLPAGPLKYLDRWLVRKEHSFVLASGIYYLGHKRLTQPAAEARLGRK